MLVLFIECWGSNLSIQAEVGKLNGDLLQLFGIRYKVWSFSVRYLISIAYWKGLIFGVKISVVVPQAIGISLCNRIGNFAREFLVVVLWGLVSWHSMYLNCSLSLVSMLGMGHVCLVEPDWCEFSLSLSVFLGFVHLFLPVHGFVTYSCVYTRFPLGFPRIHAGSLRTVAYTLVFYIFLEDSGLLGEWC